MIKKNLLAIGVIVFLLTMTYLVSISTALSGAGDKSGKVSVIRDGRLERLEGNEWKNLTAGDSVHLGNRVKTDRSAIAIIAFPDAGRMVIGPDTELELGGEKAENRFDANLQRGSVWVNTNLLPGHYMTITTSLATAGIRGTKFSMSRHEYGGDVCVCQGSVEVTLKDGRVVESHTGQAVMFDSKGIAPPKAMKIPGIQMPWCVRCHVKGGKGELKKDMGGLESAL